MSSRAAILRPFRHRDFRILWGGAFLSFTGSWVQNVAQGWLVFQLTGSYQMLGLVSFFGMIPVTVLAPFAGTLSDTLDKRKVLVLTQSIFAVCALVQAVGAFQGWIQPAHIITAALIVGIAGSFEMPARQSTISRVVPQEDLGAAVPLNAMTFNGARIVGPAIGGYLLQFFGAAYCYLVNGLSYVGLIGAAFLIKANLKPVPRKPEPIKDLILEGMLYTFRDKRLRMLFLMEATTSCFGLIYLPLLPAYTKDILKEGPAGLGHAMTAVGIGALIALFMTASLAEKPVKKRIVISAMLTMGTCLCAVAFVRNIWIAYPLLAIVGGSAIMQFNTTNTLFQTLSPERLRGRVIAMHVWALSGVGPFGTLGLAALAEGTKKSAFGGIPLALLVGGGIVLVGGLLAVASRRNLDGLP